MVINAGPTDGPPGAWLSRLPGTERQILLLRWVALLLALVLHLFDRSQTGVLFPAPAMALVVAACNGLLLFLMRHVRWLRRPLNYLALDAFVATLAVYLTGGYHSSFFVLYVFIAIGAAFYMELVPTVVVTLGLGLIYVGACYLSPAGLQSPDTAYALAARLELLLVVAVLCVLLLEQLRQEQRKAERERALASRLEALNRLFHQLSTTLDLDPTLQTVSEAPRTMLGADQTGIALLDGDGRQLSVVSAAGVDAALVIGHQWSLDEEGVSVLLSSDQPYVVDEPARHLGVLPAALAEQLALASITSVVAVPLRSDDRPLGVLGVAFSKPQTFSEEDRLFLQALGQEAALAIRNAHLYEREREQVARLRALDELQESFVSAVSHELRTPLTCIKTSVELLDMTSSGLSQEQAELIRTMGHHLSRLEVFVSDLIQITRLEAGRVALATQPTDLCALVGRVVESLRPLADRERHTVHLHLSEAVEPVEVDRRRIEQVLTNVLSNAIKFTPQGGQISVGVTERDEALRVCVADSGTGVPDADQQRIFDKFYVVRDGRGRSGLGLGLYIARELVELHGGRIWVKNREGGGSKFCFQIPRRPGRDKREDRRGG